MYIIYRLCYCLGLIPQEPAADIEEHRAVYEAMCAKCKELIGRGVQDGEELQEKLDNVQERWNAIQVCTKGETPKLHTYTV